ncbi:MAG TPA: tyrosine-type recombinase/integrase [Planktothrix sp.]
MTEITETMIKVRHQEELSDTPTTANRAMAVLSSMYSFSRKNYKDADNEPIIRHNPVSVLREMELLYDERPCKTYVNDEMKPAWYESITSLANKAAADLILLEYLCGSRHGETCRLRWENVDFNKRTFMLTGTKNGDDCLLPMSTQIEALLKRCRDRRSSEQEEWVFSAPTKLGHLDDIRETVQASRDRIGKSDWSEHDLRRTFKTCCEKVEISYITQKHLMNHSLRHNVTAGYDGREIETLRAALQKVDDKLMELATVAAKPD